MRVAKRNGLRSTCLDKYSSPVKPVAQIPDYSQHGYGLRASASLRNRQAPDTREWHPAEMPAKATLVASMKFRRSMKLLPMETSRAAHLL
jgi:hypothetical protein